MSLRRRGIHPVGLLLLNTPGGDTGDGLGYHLAIRVRAVDRDVETRLGGVDTIWDLDGALGSARRGRESHRTGSSFVYIVVFVPDVK